MSAAKGGIMTDAAKLAEALWIGLKYSQGFDEKAACTLIEQYGRAQFDEGVDACINCLEDEFADVEFMLSALRKLKRGETTDGDGHSGRCSSPWKPSGRY